MTFRNLGCLTAQNGRFKDIKNTINCFLQAAGVNLEISFTVEAYIYYQFVYLNMRIIHLPLLQIVTRVFDDFLATTFLMLSMTPKSRCTTTTSPKLRVGKYLPTCLAKSLWRTILYISTLIEILPNG